MDFKKIILVLKREYLTRVRTKSFIISTLLTPFAFIALMAIVIIINISEGEVEKKIGIIDNTNSLYERLVEKNESRYFDVSDIPIDTLKAQVLNGEVDGYIILENAFIDSSSNSTLVHSGSGGLLLIESIEDELRDVVREEQLERKEVSEEIIAIFNSWPNLDAVKLTEQGEEEDNTIFAAILGFILGLFIFMGIFIYGAILMRSVIEEKTSRIVEVIASSIKPLELMVGKLLGVTLLAVTQFAVWIGSYVGLSIVAAPIAAMVVDMQKQNIPEGASEAVASSFDPSQLDKFIVDPTIFIYFFIFFFLGFMIYSAIFAAIGSAVDSEQDTQQFMLPVMIPVFIAYFLNTKVMQDPDSSIAVFASMFPLTSPINMITRIAATDVPFWQIGISTILMAATFAGIMMLAAKIYRVGILMYGKKPSYKELVKWIRQG